MGRIAKVIAIAQQKGGSGKTTIAAHLSIALLQKGNKVAIIDIDPQGSLTAWYKAREAKLGAGYGGLHLSTKSGWRVQNEILALEEYDYIIIDSPPHDASDTKNALRDANLVLIPLQPSPTDLWATESTINFCKENNVNYGIVINRATPNSKLLQTITKGLPKILKSIIGNRVAFASSMMDGRCVTETQPTSQGSQEIKALLNEVIKLINKAA